MEIPVVNSVRERLRNETRSWHIAIERDLDLMSPDLTVDRYKKILIKYLGFYRPWEDLAAEVCRAVPEAVEQRRKTPKLLADLAYFGIDGGALRECGRLPQIGSMAEALGGCYVVEGATLGGQIIARQVQQKLQLGADAGSTFFHGYGAATGRMWKAFEELLSRYCDNGNADATVAAAKVTFEALWLWFREA